MATDVQNNLNELVKQDKICTALNIKFITAPEIVYIARNAGFQSLFIDLEHSSLSLQAANHLCITALSANVTPFVRVPRHVEGGFIQRVLDNGAQGVIFPHVDNAGKKAHALAHPLLTAVLEQARLAVQACKYPPLGKRSIALMLPSMGFRGIPFPQVLETGNASMSTVIVMIESPEAVADIDAIAATEGVDVVLIGSADLSIELGFPGDFSHPVFQESVKTVGAAVKRHGKILGAGGVSDNPELMRSFVHDLGARFVVAAGDLPLMSKALAAVMTEVRHVETPHTGDRGLSFAQ